MPVPYGIHDEEGAHLIPSDGWCLALVALSESPQAKNYAAIRQGINWIARINWGYGSTGTIPLPDQDTNYLNALGRWVADVQGCNIFIIGNEPNHEQERPNGTYITPERYADFFATCRNLIRTIKSGAIVIPAPPAPYHANPVPWTDYYRKQMLLIERKGGCDGIAVHAYLRSSDPAQVSDENLVMQHGFLKGTYSGFLTYEDAFKQLPDSMLRLPAWITEVTELLPDGWEDRNTGVIKAVYREIHGWNSNGNHPKVRGVVMYRFPQYDKWHMQGKNGVLQDFVEATQMNLETPVETHLPLVSAPANSTLERQIDPRATQRGVVIQRIPAGKAWRVVKVQWYDEAEADRVGPDHHILFDTLDEQGNRVTDLKIQVRWPSGFTDVRSEAKPGEIASANFPMTPGEFSARVISDLPSETVEGIRMGVDTPSGWNPGAHTTTLVVFRLTDLAKEVPVSQPVAVPPLAHPVLDVDRRRVTQVYGRGVNREYYSQFKVDGVPLEGHNGIDFATPVGSDIVAVADGRVVEVANDSKGYGLYVKLVHTWGESLYAHLSQQMVELGTMVRRGQMIGKSGNTGKSTGPHLHFGLRVNPYNRRDGMGGYADPALYLKETVLTPTIPVSDRAMVINAIKEAAVRTGMDFHLLLSLAWAESSFRTLIPDGLFQVGDDAWSDWAHTVGATNRNDPLDNALVGAVYLRYLINYFDHDLEDALKAYNWGVGNVLKGEDEPPLATIIYVYKVIHGRDLLKAVGYG